MADRLLLPLGSEWRLLDAEGLEKARQAAREAGFGPNAPQDRYAAAAEPLCDAAQLAESLAVPASWLAQAARDGRIPCVKLGRWVRFRRGEVEAALARPGSRKGAQ